MLSKETLIAHMLYDELAGDEYGEGENAFLGHYTYLTPEQKVWYLDRPHNAGVYGAQGLGDRWDLAQRLAAKVLDIVGREE